MGRPVDVEDDRTAARAVRHDVGRPRRVIVLRASSTITAPSCTWCWIQTFIILNRSGSCRPMIQ